MANYKVVDADQLDADLTSVADAIRAKTGTSGQMAFPSGFKTAVESIQTGGSGTQLAPNERIYQFAVVEITTDMSNILATSSAIGILT